MSDESNEISRYVPLEPKVRRLMDQISECRDEECPVLASHPFYNLPQKPPFYDGPRACMPVVPTWLAVGRIMILGMYPTCRFANVKKLQGDDWAEEVPVRDIDEPFENSRYFDAYGVRDVRAGTILYEEYLHPLGLDRRDLWITNLVKCFLFKDTHVKNYEEVGWAPLPVATRDKYLDVAKLCFKRNLAQEVELCRPKLVLTMGADVCRMVHAGQDLEPADEGVFAQVRGKCLRAHQADSGQYQRHSLFKDTNVFCFYHPSKVGSDESARKKHRGQDIPAACEFLEKIVWS